MITMKVTAYKRDGLIRALSTFLYKLVTNENFRKSFAEEKCHMQTVTFEIEVEED